MAADPQAEVFEPVPQDEAAEFGVCRDGVERLDDVRVRVVEADPVVGGHGDGQQDEGGEAQHSGHHGERAFRHRREFADGGGGRRAGGERRLRWRNSGRMSAKEAEEVKDGSKSSLEMRNGRKSAY